MANRDLVRWLLYLDLLKTNEFAGFDLNNKLSSGIVSHTFRTVAVNLGVELFGGDWLINFVATGITSIDSNHNARFHITCSCHYSSECHQTTYLIGADISHLLDSFFCIRSWHNEYLILSFQFSWQLVLSVILLDIRKALGV
jgi:hypothetical protein